MSKELEKAAEEFAVKAAPMTAEDASFNSFRIIALRELLTRAFKAGAEWAIETGRTHLAGCQGDSEHSRF